MFLHVFFGRCHVSPKMVKRGTPAFFLVFGRCHDSSKMMKRDTPPFFSRFWAVSLNFENSVTKRQKWRSVTPPPQKKQTSRGSWASEAPGSRPAASQPPACVSSAGPPRCRCPAAPAVPASAGSRAPPCCGQSWSPRPPAAARRRTEG